VKLIEQAQVEPGMTRDEVLMSLGYPPAHRTPSLDSPTWTYWANRWATFEVYFDGDRVSRVNR
jgi:outer membrane protein assembly factor BamE (lipoprotein component of BamABCDE complex)